MSEVEKTVEGSIFSLLYNLENLKKLVVVFTISFYMFISFSYLYLQFKLWHFLNFRRFSMTRRFVSPEQRNLARFREMCLFRVSGT